MKVILFFSLIIAISETLDCFILRNDETLKSTQKQDIFTIKLHFTVKTQGKSSIFTVNGVSSPSLSPSRYHPRAYRGIGYSSSGDLRYLVSCTHKYFPWWVSDTGAYEALLGKRSRSRLTHRGLPVVTLHHILWATWWRYRLQISCVIFAPLSWCRVGRPSRRAFWKS